MTEVIRSRSVDAPPAAVWDLLSDFGAIGAWAANVDHSCLLESTGVGVGTTRRIQTGRTTVVERVVTWEPEFALAYDIEGLPPAAGRVRNRWDLTPAGDGTRVSLTSSVDTGPRPPQRLVGRVVGRILAKQSETMLDGLGQALEARHV